MTLLFGSDVFQLLNQLLISNAEAHECHGQEVGRKIGKETWDRDNPAIAFFILSVRSCKLLCFPPGADYMLHCHDRVIKHHPRAGEPHDLSDLFPHLRLVAVNLAVGTEGLVFHERAPVAACAGIIRQCLALWAETGFHAVLFTAVQTDHQCDDLFFLFPFFLCVCFHRPGSSSSNLVSLTEQYIILCSFLKSNFM